VPRSIRSGTSKATALGFTLIMINHATDQGARFHSVRAEERAQPRGWARLIRRDIVAA
jgi:hypothetical protein